MKTKLFVIFLEGALLLFLNACNNEKPTPNHPATKTTLEILKTKYDKVEISETGDFYWISLNNKVGMCDTTGNIIVPIRYDAIYPYGYGTETSPYWFHVKVSGKVGVCDTTGVEIIPTIFDDVFKMGYGTNTEPYYFMVYKGDKWGMYDTHGKEVIPYIYDKLDYSTEKKGFIVKKGEEEIFIKVRLNADGTIREETKNEDGNNNYYNVSPASSHVDEYNSNLSSENIDFGSSAPTTTRTPQQSSGSTLRSCRVCAGIGKCWTCNGKRYYFSENFKTLRCPNCTNGLCTTCGGTGKVK